MGLSSLTMQCLTLVLTFLAASTLAAPTCEECKAAVDGLVERLTSEASIEEQLAVLLDTICPEAADPAKCVEELSSGWAEIAAVMYPVFLESTKVCTMLES